VDFPVFIVGCPRSGTTLVNFILNKHESCFILNEKGLYCNLLKRWTLQRTSTDRDREVFVRLMQSIVDAHQEINLLSSEEVRESVAEVTPRWDLLLESFMSALRRRHKPTAQIWGDKTPNNTFYVDEIAKRHPDARFIYVYRHPGHVLESMSKLDFPYTGNDRLANSFVLKEYIAAYESQKSCLGADQRLEVKYENLVQMPEAVTKEMCSFLEIDFDPAMMESAPRSTRMLFGWPSSKAWGEIRPQASSQTAESDLLTRSYLRHEIEQYGYKTETYSYAAELLAQALLFPYSTLNALYNYLRDLKYPVYKREVLQKYPTFSTLQSWIQQRNVFG